MSTSHNGLDEPQIIHMNLVCVNVCVPKDYTDQECIEVAQGGLRKELEKILKEKILEPNSIAVRLITEQLKDKYWRMARADELGDDPTHQQCDERMDCYHRCVVYDLPPLELFYGPLDSDTSN